MVEGLSYIHTKKISHLDIKLENIMLGNNYVVKIADFDSSLKFEEPCVGIRGTENYHAPEI